MYNDLILLVLFAIFFIPFVISSYMRPGVEQLKTGDNFYIKHEDGVIHYEVKATNSKGIIASASGLLKHFSYCELKELKIYYK